MCKHIQKIKDLDDKKVDPLFYERYNIELITCQKDTTTSSNDSTAIDSTTIDSTTIDSTTIDNTAIENDSIHSSKIVGAADQRTKEKEDVKVLLDICQKQQDVIQSSYNVAASFATALLERMKI
jgi:hypothetical protein